MNTLNIAVCLKPVPDPEYYDKITVDRTTKRLQRNHVPIIINELDRYALEKAVQLKEEHNGQITLFSMAPLNSRLALLEGLALGSDKAVLLSDSSFAGADTLATAYTLAKGIHTIGAFDLILMGDESSDGGTMQVAAQLGEILQVPRYTHVVSLTKIDDNNSFLITSKHDDNINTYRVKNSVLCAVTRDIATPRMAHMNSIKHCTEKPFVILDAKGIKADVLQIGDAGSPTKAGAIYNKEKSRKAEILQGTPDMITDTLLSEMRRIGVITWESA